MSTTRCFCGEIRKNMGTGTFLVEKDALSGSMNNECERMALKCGYNYRICPPPKVGLGFRVNPNFQCIHQYQSLTGTVAQW